MSSGVRRNVARVRTFNDDVSRARGESTPQSTSAELSQPTVPEPAPSKPVTPTPLVSDTGAISIPATTPAGAGLPTITPRVTPEPLIPPVPERPTAQPQVTSVKDTTITSPVINDALEDVTRTTFGSVGTPSFDGEDDPFATEGTIVTDKKRNRFRLLPAIGTAVSDWAGDTKSALTRNNEPTHLVGKAESRIETLKAAAKQSYQAPQDDHGVVIKRLTEKERTPVSTEVNIKAAAAVPTPTWKHLSVSTPDATTAHEPEAAPPQTKTPATPAPTVPPPVTYKVSPMPQMEVAVTEPLTATVDAVPTVTPPPEVKPVAAPPPVRPMVEPAVTPAPPVSTLEPMIPLEQTPRVTEQAVPVSRPASPVPPVPTPAPVVPPPVVEPVTKPQALTPVPANSTTPSVAPARAQNDRRALVIFLIIILGASLLGIGVTTLWFMRATPTDTATTVVRIPSLVSVSRSTPVPLRSERSDLFRELEAATAATSETQQLYFVSDAPGGSTEPATVGSVLERLAFRAPGSFTRSIKALTFGSTSGTQPFLVLQVTDFNTAFAGMLQWETNLSRDLAPLFGNTVTESFDPTARTDTQLRPAFFRDTIVANVSTRLLVDATNDERLLYGFVKPNIILITQDQATFEVIAPLIVDTP